MTERQIPFKAPMVRAILAGTKTQTRRVVKPQPADDVARASFPNPEAVGWISSRRHEHGPQTAHFCPYGVAGDRLWVREAWRSGKLTDRFPPREMTPHVVWYEADGAAPDATSGKLRPGMFMPRWASRITLEVTGVRVERLQDISEDDALAEGITEDAMDRVLQIAEAMNQREPRPGAWAYRTLWEAINGEGSWDANPWVWVVEFKTPNVNSQTPPVR